jgi:methionyl-tRNA formyltransferase
LGCLNVHPSLLPENRGPAPLFWTFREGADSTGVSVHLMTGELDAGDIVEQGVVAAPEGISGEEMDRRCSELGGALLVRSVRGLAAGTAIKRPQAPHRASYNGWPVAADFEVPVSWTARRAFRFIRGVSDWGTPPVILVNDERFRVRAALSYAEGQFLPVPYVRDGSELRVQFTPGVLRAETL